MTPLDDPPLSPEGMVGSPRSKCVDPLKFSALSYGYIGFLFCSYLAQIGFLAKIEFFQINSLRDDSAQAVYHLKAFNKLITNMLLFLS